ncbi:MAG: hypothetical protein ACR2GQ_02995 [Gemmatimonadota bacterium]
MEQGWKTIASFGALPLAELAAGRLESADIPFMIDQQDNIGIFGPGHAGGTVRGISLNVPAQYADDARAALDLGEDEEE